ncbi:hypothetical protein ANCCAN_18278 [Ancylostoma caninum]|uniref:DUF5641 domain-containing protein n=1 Tax=Ancylostoma caninum TaxID=29170 RepID=A0A368FYM9_ANCCA|nr:hypothetical protein ANCCAN_18278 [Ancylostoma caninum]
MSALKRQFYWCPHILSQSLYFYKLTYLSTTKEYAINFTVVVEIEDIIDFRPITPYREKDPSSHILKPCDFISPEVTLQLPPGADTCDIVFDGHRSSEWYKDTLEVLNCFSNIWYSEYLSALAQRHQRRLRQLRYTHSHPRVNDVVIIGDDNVPRGQWKLAIVTELHSINPLMFVPMLSRGTNIKGLMEWSCEKLTL